MRGGRSTEQSVESLLTGKSFIAAQKQKKHGATKNKKKVGENGKIRRERSTFYEK